MTAPLASPVREAPEHVRERLLTQVRKAQAPAWAAQDAELAEEIAFWERSGGWDEPTIEEQYGLDPDADTQPSDGGLAWLADLPQELVAEYLEATSVPAGPEVLKAGFWDRRTALGRGFAAGGLTDELPPGPDLAGLTHDVVTAGLGVLSDDELIGVLRAGRRLASWAAAVELAATADLLRRRLAEDEAGEAGVGEHAVDEVAAALTLTSRAADREVSLAEGLAQLPLTMAALMAGEIDLPRAGVIVDETMSLSAAHRAAVEREVIGRAPSQTTGRLRRAVARAAISVDPAAAQERKERAARDARVERWNEQSGTAALAGRDLPSAEVLAADRNLTALATQLKAAGVEGGMDKLRATVYLALLSGVELDSLLPAQGAAETNHCPAGEGGGGVSRGGPFSIAMGLQGSGFTGSVNLTLPLATWLGLSDQPGEAASFGVLDAADSRTLTSLLAGRADTQWCLTLTDRSGHAVAHGCARPRRQRGGARSGHDPTTWTFTIRTVETGECGHPRESAGYEPPPLLRHLVEVRNATCAYPGCPRSATRCDEDHTLAFQRGGRTCECNLAPLCRHHHRAKQTYGWRLTQAQPGVLVWTTPSGRSYTTRPSEYLA